MLIMEGFSMKICGIDPSMNSSGKCIMDLDPKDFSIKSIKFYGYNSVKIRCINEGNVKLTSVGTKYTKANMFDRQNIAYQIINEDMEDVKHVAFEGYAFGATKTNSIFQIGEFVGGMKKMFYDAGKGIMIYPPSVVKRFATGSGSADKTQMSAMFKEEYPNLYPEQFNLLPQTEALTALSVAQNESIKALNVPFQKTWGISGNNTRPAHIARWYRDWETDRKSTRLNSSHSAKSRMPSSA